jgi:N-formylglutamate amidohydrolase
LNSRSHENNQNWFQRFLGKRSTSVHRKFLDPNRPADFAYEDEDAKPAYDRYHESLTQFTKKVLNEFRFGLLLDIHGQGFKSDTVFRGTKDGKTVEKLRSTFGQSSHSGATSLFGILKSRGWKVHPDPHEGKEQAGFTGGYIVQTYGSHHAVGIDAVQLEFGSEYRSAGNRQKISEQLADGLSEYAKLYLPMINPLIINPIE